MRQWFNMWAFKPRGILLLAWLLALNASGALDEEQGMSALVQRLAVACRQ